jgi:uncharacterized membrane protein YidH (DUF202 family)
MALRHKIASLAALALALLFDQFFMLSKHEASLAAIIPFGDDPYDAVGSIAMIMSFPLAILSVFRAFMPLQQVTAPEIRRVFLARVQASVALGALVALASDAVAMSRHLSMWLGKPAGVQLVALMAGMAALSISVLYLIRSTVRGIAFTASTKQAWQRAALPCLVSGIALALFPEQIIQNVAIHFLTILIGFAFFFVPLSALTVAFSPLDKAAVAMEGNTPRTRLSKWMQWGAVAGVGFAIGAFALEREIIGEGRISLPAAKLLIVASVFIGAGMSGLLMAFTFLKKPLGLFRKGLN